MNYNRVLSVADYAQWGITSRKAWEIQMALRTLADFGAAHRGAEVLGAGAGYEATIYHLSNAVKRVFATDLYVDSGVWDSHAPRTMLTDPAALAQGVPHDPQRIVVQHMDMLDLHYPDDTFDGVFSSGSIEHVGTFHDVAQAARELGRVLKPGGILSLSTEWKLSGDGDGWPGVLLFDAERLQEYIVEPSGCELVDELVVATDAATLATAWPLDVIVRDGKRPALEGVIRHGAYTFTSVHVALRK